MKIYTRRGDDGTTSLIGGQRAAKSDPRFDCCGAVDELNAALGLASAVADSPMLESLRAVQHELFIIGSLLAAPNHPESLPQLEPAMIARLEQQIDSAENQLPPLSQFILPAGTELACRLHLARAVCRRAERLIVSLSMQIPLAPLILSYVNRLSDWLFTMARLANHLAGQGDIPRHKPQ